MAKTDKISEANTNSPSTGMAPAAPQQTADTGASAAANPGTPEVPTASTGAQSGASVPPPASAAAPTTPAQNVPAAPDDAKDDKPKRFRVVAPKKVTRQRIGLEFENGEALTSNAFKAHAAMEIGCRVFYTATGDPAFGTEEPEVQAALNQRAVAARW